MRKIAMVCLTVILLTNGYAEGLPKSAVKLDGVNNPDCVEYFSYQGESYCTTDKHQITPSQINWPQDEQLNIQFDERLWKMAWGKKNEAFTTIEYIPDGDSLSNWGELITSQYIANVPEGVTPQAFMLTIEHKLKKVGLNPDVHVLYASPDQVIFEFRIYEPSSMRQNEIQKVLKTPNGLYILHYVIKEPDMGEKRRSAWLERLKNSNPKEDDVPRSN
ncbi:hypothetical protein [Legionella sp. W05-934-2]|uniref:hypothetical protein n=1 Tax=Legionella sp. W05-934-2 TaxID=1198649 RepID=UPI0034626FD7